MSARTSTPDSSLLRALELPATRSAVLRSLLKQFHDGALTAEENALLNTALSSSLDRAPVRPSHRRSQSSGVQRGSDRGSAARTTSFGVARPSSDRDSGRHASEQPTVRELMDESAAMIEGALPPPVPLSDDPDGELSAETLDVDEARFLMHDIAASKLQSAWRLHRLGHDSTRYIVEHLGLNEASALHQAPSLEVAKQAARDFLPRRADGELFTPTEGLGAFDSFGVEVSCYMRFVVYTGRVFVVALLLNLSNIISNVDGGGGAANLLATFSLNNADCLGSSYGIIEALTSAIFVGYVWWLRLATEGHAKRIRREEEADELLTAANFTVSWMSL